MLSSLFIKQSLSIVGQCCQIKISYILFTSSEVKSFHNVGSLEEFMIAMYYYIKWGGNLVSDANRCTDFLTLGSTLSLQGNEYLDLLI